MLAGMLWSLGLIIARLPVSWSTEYTYMRCNVFLRQEDVPSKICCTNQKCYECLMQYTFWMMRKKKGSFLMKIKHCYVGVFLVFLFCFVFNFCLAFSNSGTHKKSKASFVVSTEHPLAFTMTIWANDECYKLMKEVVTKNYSEKCQKCLRSHRSLGWFIFPHHISQAYNFKKVVLTVTVRKEDAGSNRMLRLFCNYTSN